MPLDSISPTGTPILSPKWVPWLALAGAVLVPVAMALQDPSPWGAAKFGKLLASAIPALLGILSPGLRKSDGVP